MVSLWTVWIYWNLNCVLFCFLGFLLVISEGLIMLKPLPDELYLLEGFQVSHVANLKHKRHQIVRVCQAMPSYAKLCQAMPSLKQSSWRFSLKIFEVKCLRNVPSLTHRKVISRRTCLRPAVLIITSGSNTVVHLIENTVISQPASLPCHFVRIMPQVLPC